MDKYIPDVDLFSLCDLRGNNLIASGGNNLKIFKINYEINFLTLVETFNNNKKIFSTLFSGKIQNPCTTR